LSRQDMVGSVSATVERVVHLGFEVRVDLAVAGEPPVADTTIGEPEGAWVQMTRGEVGRLGLEPGDQVFVRPTDGVGSPVRAAVDTVA